MCFEKSDILIQFKKLGQLARCPQRMTTRASGFDLFSSGDHEIEVGKIKVVGTAIAVEIPRGFEGQIRPRSGWAARMGMTVLNAPGTIDSDYRGEIKVILINLGNDIVCIESGQSIAQLVIAPVPCLQVKLVDELTSSERGCGGFGSTGI